MAAHGVTQRVAEGDVHFVDRLGRQAAASVDPAVVHQVGVEGLQVGSAQAPEGDVPDVGDYMVRDVAPVAVPVLNSSVERTAGSHRRVRYPPTDKPRTRSVAACRAPSSSASC